MFDDCIHGLKTVSGIKYYSISHFAAIEEHLASNNSN